MRRVLLITCIFSYPLKLFPLLPSPPLSLPPSLPLPPPPPPTFLLSVTFYTQTDIRESNMMRVAPAPLYNSFTDVFRMFTLLQQAMERN